MDKITIPDTATTDEDRALAIGQQLARHVFHKRGDHSEAHLGELELAAVLALAAQYGQASVLERVSWRHVLMAVEGGIADAGRWSIAPSMREAARDTVPQLRAWRDQEAKAAEGGDDGRA
ncbi:MAG: hypothetical protein AB7S57_19655 [Acetobacteraceae bacterium]